MSTMFAAHTTSLSGYGTISVSVVTGYCCFLTSFDPGRSGGMDRYRHSDRILFLSRFVLFPLLLDGLPLLTCDDGVVMTIGGHCQ